ncbi:MAG TPA: Fe-S protein assembly co-chaperone HscB, partial [Terriglobales bacterium]|nr:Fe-S protein assembly co-chaperone HscB [Terriglobales bacterium]
SVVNHFMATETQNPATATLDYFSVFGLPRKLNLDESALQREFYRLSREFHPDKFARSPATEQQAAMEKSSRLNDAYRTLKEPIARTQHLLELEGVKLEEQSSAATQAARVSGNEKKQVVPPELLEEVFELNMQLQEMRMNKEMGESDPSIVRDLTTAKEKFEASLDATTRELQSIWNHWDAVVDNPANEQRNSIRDKMVDLLNRRSYIRNLVRDVNNALES